MHVKERSQQEILVLQHISINILWHQHKIKDNTNVRKYAVATS